MNNACIGHTKGLCGTEKEMLPIEIAGVFATEPDCQGIRVRGLTDKERSTPGNQLPLLLYVYYEGTHGREPYMGTGKDEIEGWMFTFNGPHGCFAANARTEQVMVKKVCMAARGLGADIDKSVGYTQLAPLPTCRKFKLSLGRQKIKLKPNLATNTVLKLYRESSF